MKEAALEYRTVGSENEVKECFITVVQFFVPLILSTRTASNFNLKIFNVKTHGQTFT